MSPECHRGSGVTSLSPALQGGTWGRHLPCTPGMGLKVWIQSSRRSFPPKTIPIPGMFLCAVPGMLQPRDILCPLSPPVPTGGPRAAPPRPSRVQAGFGPVPGRGGSSGQRDGRTDGRRRPGGDCASVRPHQETQHRLGGDKGCAVPSCGAAIKPPENSPKLPKSLETSRGPPPARSEG